MASVPVQQPGPSTGRALLRRDGEITKTTLSPTWVPSKVASTFRFDTGETEAKTARHGITEELEDLGT